MGVYCSYISVYIHTSLIPGSSMVIICVLLCSRVLLLERQRNPYACLPQVIGLTASLGVGSNRDRPIDHYIMMCANLNCHSIEYVRDETNKRELLCHNPKPSQDQIKAVPPREDAGFSATIRRMVCVGVCVCVCVCVFVQYSFIIT